RSHCGRLPRAARRRGPAVRAVQLGLRRRLRRGRPPAAARGLPPDVDDLPAADPPGGRAGRRRPARAVHRRGLPDGRLAGARDLRHVRHRLRRPPGADPNPDAGRLGRLSAAQGLPARRDPGGVQGRRDSAARPAEGVLMTEKTTHGAQRLSDVTTGTDTTERGSTGDPYAPSRETTEGRVYTVTGGDWDEVMADVSGDEKIIMNLGPQHPSTHGVLRLIVELEGETVTDLRSVVGYLHTGIEKNVEYRTWTQG